MNRLSELLQHQAEHPSLILKVVNAIAAALGIGTFLQLVNVVVGGLSALWLATQLYGYWRYELPAKREKLGRLQAGLTVNSTQPGDLK